MFGVHNIFTHRCPMVYEVRRRINIKANGRTREPIEDCSYATAVRRPQEAWKYLSTGNMCKNTKAFRNLVRQ